MMRQRVRRTLLLTTTLLVPMSSVAFVPLVPQANQRRCRHSHRLLLAGDNEEPSCVTTNNNDKKIVFLRHGCTYMNEYLGNGVSFGEPGFSDVFESPHELESYYRDSPLSPRGAEQARGLARSKPAGLLRDLDLVVVSPLRRALQTMDLGLRPHLVDREIPILATPLAAERLYLISDVGTPVRELKSQYDYVDFDAGFDDESKKVDSDSLRWWWSQCDEENETTETYVEWRPSGQGQEYACPGEPEDAFDLRMTQLYDWLGGRPESKIAVVCHWGVIDWMINKDFGNCRWQEVPFRAINPRALVKQEQEQLIY